LTRLADLLSVPGTHLELLLPITPDPVVESIFVAERLDDLGQASPRSVVVLGANACSAVDGYQFDIALRLASSRDVVALVLGDAHAPRVNPTALESSRRFGIAIVRPTEPVNLADLVTTLGAGLRGSAELALRRAVDAFGLLAAASSEPHTLVENVAQAVDADIALLDSSVDGMAFPITVDGEPDRWVVFRHETPGARPELLLVGKLLADSLALAAAASRRAEDLPIRSRAQLLSEIMESSVDDRSELLGRARGIGIPIDGWHVVVRIEHDTTDDARGDEVRAFEAREELGRTVLDAVNSTGGVWHLARAESSLVVVRMYRNDPGPSASGTAVKAASSALQAATERGRHARLYCGVGTAHPGASGLINSAAEARAAVAASRARNRPNVATAFDSLGLRRALVEWYASHTARKAVETVLAPLDQMGKTKADSAIRTLQVYLDNHGSLSQTASVLHLHRNSVAYRVSRIFSELDVDPDNPDDWLLLQLACRARGLT
jgi:sugar diacid utilization regulator